jgi:hypothetical protein
MLDAASQPKTLHARVRAFARRRPDPVAALASGLIATVFVFLALQLISVVIYDESAWKLPRMVAALARGAGALEPDDEFDAAIVAIGAALFAALSLLYALCLCRIVADAPRRHAGLIGIAFGVALYYANFHGFTALFPWFVPLRTPDTLIVHALFGFIVAQGYWFFKTGNRLRR